jgi:phenylalanyl-tRNA synthetase alpha chain
MWKRKVEEIIEKGKAEIQSANDEKSLYEAKVRYLGRKGRITDILKTLKDLKPDEQRILGPLANLARKDFENAYEKRKKELGVQINWENEKIDVTLPGKKIESGHLHPITLVYREIEKIFSSMGFEIVEGPELESDWYNFTSLNFPFDHPARDMQDTFWIKSENEKMVLRTHTSPVQVRYMEKRKPPFRIIVPGRVFRNEATDATHEHTLHQFEALVVGDVINVGNFKHIAKQFFSEFFEKNIDIRLRPSFFPFTEPSFEFDISCTVCLGKGCPSCKYFGWLEIGGAGMVNQNVFVAAGYPRNKYQGFAWGFGIERLAMMKYKIDDIRWFESGDLRFINQF